MRTEKHIFPKNGSGLFLRVRLDGTNQVEIARIIRRAAHAATYTRGEEHGHYDLSSQINGFRARAPRAPE